MAGFDEGSEAIVPAYFLRYITEKQNTATAKLVASYVVDGVSILTGVGTFLKAGKWIYKAWGAFEIANGIGNMALNTYGDDLPESMQNLVEYSNWMMLAVAGKQILKGAYTDFSEAFAGVRWAEEQANIMLKVTKQDLEQLFALIEPHLSTLKTTFASSKSSKALCKFYEYMKGAYVKRFGNLDEVVNGVWSVYNSFSKAIDFGGDILKTPGKKLNILERANPKNGTIGTKKMYDELIAKGVPENELTGLFTQMPPEWNNLTIIDMNTKYWNEINKIHIDNVITNGGDIRFIHDPRLPENQCNYVEDMLDGPFKQKCISEGLVKVKTFMKMEYDYLLSMGYLLQENGLMIKP